MLEIGIALMFIGLSGAATKIILENIEEEDDPIEIPGQFKRLGSSRSLAGMDSPDKDAYIRHLQTEITRLSGKPTAPAWAFTGGIGDAGDANPETLVRPSITAPSPPSITPQNHLPSPLASPPHHLPSPAPSPLASPDYILNFPPVDLPFDAPSQVMKAKDLILRSMTKAEVLEQVWGLTKSDKTGRPESKYVRCSRLFDQLKMEVENEIKLSVRQELEFMENL